MKFRLIFICCTISIVSGTYGWFFSNSASPSAPTVPPPPPAPGPPPPPPFFSAIPGAPLQLQPQPATSRTKSVIMNTPTDLLYPDIDCLLLDTIGCRIACNVICDIFGCTSKGLCYNDVSCDCNAFYTIASEKVPTDEYQALPFATLWDYKFQNSTASMHVSGKIRKHPKLSKTILKMLRNPRELGTNIKSHLIRSHPKWTKLHELRPNRIGVFDRLLTDDGHIDAVKLETFIRNKIKRVSKKVVPILPTFEDRVLHLLPTITNSEDLKNLMQQASLSEDTTLYDYIRDYTQSLGYDVSSMLDQTDQRYDIDSIVSVIVAETLVTLSDEENHTERERTTNTMPRDIGNARDTIQLSENRYGDMEKSWKTGTGDHAVTLSENRYGDIDQDWKIGNNGVKVKLSKTRNGDVDQSWKTGSEDGQVKLSENRYGDVTKSWKNGDSLVKLSKNRYGDVEQRWKVGDSDVVFSENRYGDVELNWTQGDVKIHLTENRYGDIDHKWDLGDVKLITSINRYGDKDLTWKVDGAEYTISVSRYDPTKFTYTGSIDRNIINQYKAYISNWCSQNAKNYTKKCVLFDEFPK